MTKTEQEIVDELRLLSPADLAKVFALAYTISAAHDAGEGVGGSTPGDGCTQPHSLTAQIAHPKASRHAQSLRFWCLHEMFKQAQRVKLDKGMHQGRRYSTKVWRKQE